jgi:hypothetical protein
MSNIATHPPDGLLTVQELANLLRLNPSWVYLHADELGVYRLGKYLRFSMLRVVERLQKGPIASAAVGSSTQRPASTATKKGGSNGQGTDEEQKTLDSEF